MVFKMRESWKYSTELVPLETTAYVVCLNCHHSYVEKLHNRPDPCPLCKSTTNQDQYDAVAGLSAQASELDPDDKFAYAAGVATINDLPAPIYIVKKRGSRM